MALGLFWSFGDCKEAVINTLEQVSFWTWVFISLRQVLNCHAVSPQVQAWSQRPGLSSSAVPASRVRKLWSLWLLVTPAAAWLLIEA